MSRPDEKRAGIAVTFTGPAAVAVRRAVTVTVLTTAALTFVFGFGNGWAIGVQLGVPAWIAPLTAPAVDLSVVGLLVAIHVLRAQGVQDRLLGPRLLLGFTGLVTLALNTTAPILAAAYGRAAFDAICPLLLIFWSEVGPKLLAALHGTVPGRSSSSSGPTPVVRDEKLFVPEGLVARACQLDAEHRQATSRPISRDRLRAGLKVSNAVTGEVLRQLRAQAQGP